MKKDKPLLALDFDGVLHSYDSGWQGADVVNDPPVPGAMEFVLSARKEFTLAVFSARSGQPGGIIAMQDWMHRHLLNEALILYRDEKVAHIQVGKTMGKIQWPTEKPPAFVTIDDRAITFTGTFPDLDQLKAFRPWNKQE